MSRFEKGLPMKLDAEGNLDTGYLAKELNAALQYDIHYKQVDNMKKKAVKTSGTYDDFKAMVACSHLKTLTSKEVESLSAKKTGWQREFQSNSASGTHILTHEVKKSDIEQARSLAAAKQGAEAVDAIDRFRMPKNLVVLESDICRTLRSKDARMSYLLVLGLKRLKQLLKGDKDCPPELLEALLGAVLHAAAVQEQEQVQVQAQQNVAEAEAEVEAASSSAGQGSAGGAAALELEFSMRGSAGADGAAGAPGAGNETASVIASASAEKTGKKMDVFKWLKAVSSFPRFFITVLFVSKPLVAAAAEYLTGYEVANGPEEEVLAAETQRQEVLSRFLPK